MDYSKAGVNIDKGNKAKKAIKDLMKKTYNKNVLSELGGFGGLYHLKNMKDPVLVSSVDSVGTKLKLAFLTGKHNTIGIDIVNHCVNDILVQGAKPLFFLDYLGMHRVEPLVVKAIVTGLTKACKENGMALIGGETAELRDLYSKDEYDLAGSIIGVVDKEDIVTGEKIKIGDVLIGLKSSGLHTNGYTLARKVLLKKKNSKIIKELMKPHKSYLKEITSLKGIDILGMAHITGGGLLENIPRVLPAGVDACLNISWKIPDIFKLIQKKGNVKELEMFRAFNMGIGYVVIVDKKDADKVLKKIKGSVKIGKIVHGSRKVVFS